MILKSSWLHTHTHTHTHVCVWFFVCFGFGFGCAESSLLCVGAFSGCSEQGLVSSWGAWASHRAGFFCCAAQTRGVKAQ